MPISGWVLTLGPDESQRIQVVQRLQSDARVTVGEPAGARLPVVLETSSPNEGHAMIEDLSDSPGVLFIELVCLDFSDVEVYDGELPRHKTRSEASDAVPMEVQS